MLALALSFAFFLFLTVLGRATLALCNWRGGVLRSWLLAPAVGLATAVLAVMVLNQAGLPIAAFARPMTIGLAVLAAAVLAWRRPELPLRALLPFLAVVFFALIWTGWPAFRFGFGWLSYVNDDYVNYCFAAERFKNFGFWRVPTSDELAGRDWSQYYWFMHVPGLMRFGSEHVLAWISALTGVRALGIFMPVIIGFGLVQIFAAAGLTLHHGRWRRRALFGAVLLAVSPLFMLGMLYQLIAQVGGLALLLAATAILTSRLPSRRRRLIPSIAVLSIVGAALAIFYPEVTAFAVLTTLLVGGLEWLRGEDGPAFKTLFEGGLLVGPVRWLRRRTFPHARLSLVIYGVLGVIILLRYNVISYIFTLFYQFRSGFRTVDLSLSLFPYFLVPTGLSNLFGFLPLAVNFSEPFTSLSILGGIVLLLTAFIFAVRETFTLFRLTATPLGARATPAPSAALLIVLLAVSFKLYTGGNDFGLYKAAMFMQPTLAAALACAVLALPRARWTAPAAVLVFALCCAPTALYYTKVSQGEKAGGITEAKLASILGTKPPATPPNTRLLADISNLGAAKLAATELRGTDLRFLSRDYFQQFVTFDFTGLEGELVSLHPHFDLIMSIRPMLAKRDADTILTPTIFGTGFRAPNLAFSRKDPHDAYLTLSSQLGLFNKFRLVDNAAQPTDYFTEIPTSSPAAVNHLVFVHSNRGNHYYLGDRHRIAMYQQEADPHTDDHDITGMGRFMLIRVEQPTPEIYLRIAVSKTFMGTSYGIDHTAWSSTTGRVLAANEGPRVRAQTDVPLGFVGHGAVNRIIGPIRPVIQDGAAYVALDLAETPFQFAPQRRGLQALYNTSIPLDSRLLVCYGRDISALSPAEFAALPRPTLLSKFPADLVFARGLEFSGIYEDGWLSPHSEFVLGQAPAGALVRLRGYVPEIPNTSLGRGSFKVVVNGRSFDLPAVTGAFDWLLPVSTVSATTQISIVPTVSGKLPNGDNRPVGAKLDQLEVLPALPGRSFDFATSGALRLAADGIDQDGWMARHAVIHLPASATATDVVLSMENPGWSGAPTTTLRLQLSGAPATEHPIAAGTYATLRIRVPASATAQTLTVEAPADFPLPAPDTRRRAGRLLKVDLTAAPDL
ncbi:MAG: hypothetical protein NTV51_09300 [Verrucomicrobia bacterium]|nr:hypothetical protein [Verrucomicrobiota bacterium]